MDPEQEKILDIIAQDGLIANIINPSPEVSYSAQLFSIRLLLASFFNFLSVFCKSPCKYDSSVVNDIYLRHCIIIEDFVKLPEFKELELMYKRPFQSLIKGGADEPDFGVEWDYWGPQLANLISKVEELFIRNGSKTFKLEDEFKIFLSLTEKTIKEYRKKTDAGFAQIVKQLEGRFGKQEEENDHSEREGEVKYYAKDGDIELDRHIWLHQEDDKCYLLLNKKGNGFEKRISIRPQTYKIIRAAHGVRPRDPSGLKLSEFCHPRKIAKNDQTISTRIKELKELCEEHGVSQILTKFPGDRWGLNRSLGCCK